MTDKPACRNCRHHALLTAIDKSLVHICRRYPPTSHFFVMQNPQGQFIQNEPNTWPKVSIDDWCGEYDSDVVQRLVS